MRSLRASIDVDESAASLVRHKATGVELTAVHIARFEALNHYEQERPDPRPAHVEAHWKRTRWIGNPHCPKVVYSTDGELAHLLDGVIQLGRIRACEPSRVGRRPE